MQCEDWIPDQVGNDKVGGGKDRISYKVKCKRKKEQGLPRAAPSQ